MNLQKGKQGLAKLHYIKESGGPPGFFPFLVTVFFTMHVP